jgi:hypothetical protein
MAVIFNCQASMVKPTIQVRDGYKPQLRSTLPRLPEWVTERTRSRGNALRAERSKWRGRADQLIRRL